MARETLYWTMIFITGDLLKGLIKHPELICFVRISLAREELHVFDAIQASRRPRRLLGDTGEPPPTPPGSHAAC